MINICRIEKPILVTGGTYAKNFRECVQRHCREKRADKNNSNCKVLWINMQRQ